jgi:hypothetical protein
MTSPFVVVSVNVTPLLVPAGTDAGFSVPTTALVAANAVGPIANVPARSARAQSGSSLRTRRRVESRCMWGPP